MDWKAYHKRWGLGALKYKPGDIVTRDGSDHYVILETDYPFITMTVRCIKEPRIMPPIEEGDVPRIRLREVESDLIRRYQLVRKVPR